MLFLFQLQACRGETASIIYSNLKTNSKIYHLAEYNYNLCKYPPSPRYHYPPAPPPPDYPPLSAQPLPAPPLPASPLPPPPLIPAFPLHLPGSTTISPNNDGNIDLWSRKPPGRNDSGLWCCRMQRLCRASWP